MATREEIRKGINQILIEYEGSYVWELTAKIVTYLHNNDVVIRVEGELPKCGTEYNPTACGAEDDIDNCYRGGWDEGQGAMSDAGYVAVEPLLEE